MKKFLIVLIIVITVTFAVPFLSLINTERESKNTKSDEIVTIFSSSERE